MPDQTYQNYQATSNRMSKEKVILAIQDTTTLNYTNHSQTHGLGTIGTNKHLQGMLVHTTLAFTPQRVPLGILHQQVWTRSPETYGKKHQRKKRAITEKESQKWLNSLEATRTIHKESPDTLVISVGDREADIYELFHHASDYPQSCHLLVRAAWDRKVEHPQKYLWPSMETQPVADTFEVIVPRKKNKSERSAHIDIRFAPLTLLPPQNKSRLGPLTLWAVYVNEPSPPHGEEPLSWMLLTTLKVESLDEALCLVNYYSVRFSIELFHKVLKSGCTIEKRQLQTAEGLIRCLALDSLVAWRIMFLTMIGRAVPQLPCTVLFGEHEWKALYCFINTTKTLPLFPPSLQEATRLVARLGGFLGRERDGFPGTEILWRGMQKLASISAAWIAFGPHTV
ncbi:MAG: IS4 family transposase [Candidatus Jettenia caeni]|nr:MAG: IS4 family transposase [Candidatus Jettenia caeni]